MSFHDVSLRLGEVGSGIGRGSERWDSSVKGPGWEPNWRDVGICHGMTCPGTGRSLAFQALLHKYLRCRICSPSRWFDRAPGVPQELQRRSRVPWVSTNVRGSASDSTVGLPVCSGGGRSGARVRRLWDGLPWRRRATANSAVRGCAPPAGRRFPVRRCPY